MPFITGETMFISGFVSPSLIPSGPNGLPVRITIKLSSRAGLPIPPTTPYSPQSQDRRILRVASQAVGHSLAGLIQR